MNTMLLLFSLLVLTLGQCSADCPVENLQHCMTTVGEPRLDGSDMCSGFSDWLSCVEDQQSDSCVLEETNGVTFSDLRETINEYCPMVAELSAIGMCGGDMPDCLMCTKYFSLLGLNTGVEGTGQTGFWCSLIVELFYCAAHHHASCGYDVTNVTRVGSDIEFRCDGATIPEGSLLAVLVLSTATLVLQMIMA